MRNLTGLPAYCYVSSHFWPHWFLLPLQHLDTRSGSYTLHSLCYCIYIYFSWQLLWLFTHFPWISFSLWIFHKCFIIILAFCSHHPSYYVLSLLLLLFFFYTRNEVLGVLFMVLVRAYTKYVNIFRFICRTYIFINLWNFQYSFVVPFITLKLIFYFNVFS